MMSLISPRSAVGRGWAHHQRSTLYAWREFSRPVLPLSRGAIRLTAQKSTKPLFSGTMSVRATSQSLPVDDTAGQWAVGVGCGASAPGYSGVHDVGGVESLLGGMPLNLEEKSYSLWERQTHALLLLLVNDGRLSVDELRRAIEGLHPVHYANWGYYEKWAVAMASVLLETGVISGPALDQALGNGRQTSGLMKHFKEGDIVRVKKELLASRWRKPHLRTPGYIFGASGIVERYCGHFNDPEFLAFRGDGDKQPLYRVRFLQKDIWREYDGADGDTVDVEIYQSWLESNEQIDNTAVGSDVCVNHPKSEGGLGKQSARPPRHRRLRSIAQTVVQELHDHGHTDVTQDSTVAHHAHGDHEHQEADHVHLSTTETEQQAVDKEGMERPGQRVAESLIRLLSEQGVISFQALQRAIKAVDSLGTHAEGPRLVARAWTDPGFRARLLQDPSAAAAELGLRATNSTSHTVLTVVESTDTIHNLVVCTLCSCYPTSILGLPPPWYKSREYRARAVREPRRLLRESFGLVLPDEVAIRVHDSTADLRYIVLPRRPAGTDGWSEDQLQALVTRDAMIGTAVLNVPGDSELPQKKPQEPPSRL
eukprot:TRINITY_DN19653_c0_g1_i7.p1 TRINITY_DN19653_c0_g1~~TRINITY_DN19653_c0_g1_i7.p1  ORF type:complete len:594 (-),score=81.17 TRINITY_DN19653_c0_g1_i7:207-1988(-)